MWSSTSIAVSTAPMWRSFSSEDATLSFPVAANDPDGMVQWAEECTAMGVKYIWDPGQQCARMEGSQLKSGVTGAFMVIVNDYEFELIRQKTGLDEAVSQFVLGMPEASELEAGGITLELGGHTLATFTDAGPSALE